MPNVCLTIAYDGTRYAGWQFQKNADTIQEKIEHALKEILGEDIKVIGAGRTDSGVHSRAQLANFTTKKLFPLAKLQAALNTNLPEDIVIVKIREVPPKFHARFDAKSKVYSYAILNSNIDDPLSRPYYWKVSYKLDLVLLKKEAKVLIGTRDFKAFQAKSAFSKLKTTVRTIKSVSVCKDKKFIYIQIEADGFLRNMARNIVGTLIDIGRGYLPEGSMEKILNSRERRQAGQTAPAKGLTLLNVKFDKNYSRGYT